MKPTIPHAMPDGARLVVLAKDQPQYDPLPVALCPDGLVMTEWALSAEDLAVMLRGGRVRLWVWTFGHPFQPVALEVVED